MNYQGLMGLVLMAGVSGCVAMEHPARFIYEQEPLVMTADALRDANGAFTLAQLPQPRCQVKLKGEVTPLTERMWAIALDDVERNLVTNEAGVVYFGAGTRYGDRVYTRDLSIAGVLGVNQLYPKQMLSSLKLTREVRRGLGYRVSAGHDIREIDAPWEVIAEIDREIMLKYKTNSYTRRTDDVVWLWAADDLFTLHPEIADWKWMLENGEEFFKVFYEPWFDAKDGLYRGQALYHDIQHSCYPKGYSKADCVLLKALSTNCLYYRAMLAMANACEKAGRPAAEKQAWLERAATLKLAIQTELTNPDGTTAYFKDRHGVLMPNRPILGTAFAVLFGVIEGDAAKVAYEGYPTTDKGIPLFFPFLDNKGDHNQASWPFCSTFFLHGKTIATGEDTLDYNAALLARSLGTAIKPPKKIPAGEEWDAGFGSFHEKISLPDGLIGGSGHQLWSAAAYLDVCIRAELIE
ncbi:hypothetical protein [Pontiella sulfatireligans]|uniref:Alpha-L-rhamnosidase six-hairpin glycosidase domain-containing protein n=1 Tax=Pontiella sulfatireligans TaxID=2750658 RepID=A0A6C2UMU6_9BACT|nr:hypothetical protein [Pontiella sulfatireligans]VGO20697.1 hypothetical protein SCARR_02764 [Pontiella sulfatireligans]